MLVKNSSFHASFQGYFAEVNFDNFQETSCHIFKTAIFSKLYGAFMAHIIRENAGKNFKMISELSTNKNFEYTFVLFVSDQSLKSQLDMYQRQKRLGLFFQICVAVSRNILTLLRIMFAIKIPPSQKFDLYLSGLGYILFN